jgi:hypothetical protein
MTTRRIYGIFIVMAFLSSAAWAETRVWTGLSTNLPPQWDDANNWKDKIPADDDDVIIGSNSEGFHVNFNGKIRLKSLTITRSQIIGKAQITAGTVNCTGSEFSGGGTLTISDAAQVKANIGGPGMTLGDTYTVNNSGSVAVNAGSEIAFSATGANEFNNSGVVRLGSGSGLTGGLFKNSRMLIVDAGGGSARVTGTVINSGTVEIASGKLEFSTGSTANGDGNWLTDGSDCVLDFNGAKLNLTGGGFSGDGSVALVSSVMSLASGVSMETLSVTGATINGPGTLILQGHSLWNGATLQNKAGLLVDAKGTLELLSDVFRVDGGGADNYGTFVQRGTATLQLANGAAFNNIKGATATFDNTGPGRVETSGTNTSVFRNSGTLITAAHTNSAAGTTILTRFDNDGTVEVNSTLTLNGGGMHSGTFSVHSETNLAVLDFHVGTNQWDECTFQGQVVISGGAVFARSLSTLQDLRLEGGTLSCVNNLVVERQFKWGFGTLSGSGEFDVDTLLLDGVDGTRHWSDCAMTVSKIGGWTGGDIDAQRALLVVESGCIFTISCDQTWSAPAGQHNEINNSGIISKIANKGITSIQADFVNQGTFRQSSGRVRFLQSYTQTAGQTVVETNSTIEVQNVLTNYGTLGGNGRFIGKIRNSGKTAAGKSPGLLTVEGPYEQDANGSVEVELAGTNAGESYDQLAVYGAATLDGSLNVTLLNGFVPKTGDRFEVMRFDSRTGTFPVSNGLRIGGNMVLAPLYSATNLVLVATNANLVTPLLTAGTGADQRLHLSWENEAGQSYEVQFSNDLLSWFVLTNVTGSAGILEFSVPISDAPKQFFRLR